MSEIILKQPVSLLNRDVKFDLKEFFIQASSTVAGTAIQVATANPIGALTSIVRGLSSTSKSISDVPVEQRAWLLVVTSLTHAIAKVLEDFNDLFENNIEESQLNIVSEQLTNQINEIKITLTNEFFNNPHQLSFLNDLSPILKNWLQQLGLNDSQASSFIYQFKSQFPMSLHHEWGTNPAYYALIVEKLDTPFNTANRLQRQASEYRYWLQQQVSERVFEEAFGLKQIYVPLRAYYIKVEDSNDEKVNENIIEAESNNILKPNHNENITKTVCNLHEEINEWVRQADTEDNLKVISGGPGSGKSSFAKILASELAESSDIPILFVPLHRFKISDYIHDAMRRFLDNHHILNPDNLLDESKLLLIFDGLDELTMQGSNSKEVANGFIEELKEVLQDKKTLHWKAIVTGRELSIQQQQSKLKKRKTILHLLPYFINEDDREDFNDVNNLLLEDQRDEWWHKFGELKGKNFAKLPSILATENLETITKEPLLNYLLSLSYLREDIAFTKDTNINQIYADLLDSVHERKYTGSRTHTGINNIEKEKFIRILEEIALVVWHESGRTARIDRIMERCREVGLANYFDKFKDDAESGVVRLLMAFYFREFDGNQGDKTFEFTHKSFGEYLTARRIMLELKIMLEEVERGRNAPGCGWTLEAAFEKWIRLCGPQSIDGYLSDFLEGEIRIKSETKFGLSEISKYQELMIELIQLAVNGQSPVKKLNLAAFSEDLTYVRNAEVALLTIHSLCARNTNKIIRSIKYENNEAFDKWLNLLDYKLMPKLNHLYLPNITVYSTFIAGNFESSELNNADLLFCELFIANFKNSVLEGANLSETRAESASFEDANLKNTELKAANFRGSNFVRANLKNANIKGTNFTNANLENANFEDTNHDEAIFTGANLKGTILENLYPPKEELEE